MKKFSIVENGYNQKEVNEFLDIVINRLEKVGNKMLESDFKICKKSSY